jgi:type I restriction enzyme, R subunit
VSFDELKKAETANLIDNVIGDAVEALIGSEEVKRRYLDLANTVQRLFKAVLPDLRAHEFASEVSPIKVIADKIRALVPSADISQVMEQVEVLLDQSIATEGYVIREVSDPDNDEHLIDLSAIDFDKLAEKFKTSRKRTLNEKLKGSVGQKLMAMVLLNRTRMDYLERFQQMIAAYNAGSLNPEEFFRQLVTFAQSLNEEEKRGVSEQLTEEELALFDLLMKPPIEMSDADREKVKATAKELLVTLKNNKLVLDWRKRQQARAAVRVAIDKLLDDNLPRAYTPELFRQKSTAVFQHVYDAYHGSGRSVYVAA